MQIMDILVSLESLCEDSDALAITKNATVLRGETVAKPELKLFCLVWLF